MVATLNYVRNFFRKLSDEFLEIRFAAASLSFSTLFSIIPFLFVILAIFQTIGGLDELYPEVEKLILAYLKEATGSTVTKYLKNSIYLAQAQAVGYTGVAFLLFSTLGLFRNIDTAFHRIWKIKPKKPFMRRLWLHSIVMVSLPVLIAAFIGIRSLGTLFSLHRNIPQQIGFGIAGTLVLWLLYTMVPDTKVSKRAALVSAVLASIALGIVQNSFLWFSLKVFKQNKIYGSLASFPIFMLWLLVVWTIVLSGTSLCAFLQQKIFKRA